MCILLSHDRARFKIASTGERFDLVAALEVIEHVEDPPGFTSSLVSLTRPRGMLTISTINRTAKVRSTKHDTCEKTAKRGKKLGTGPCFVLAASMLVLRSCVVRHVSLNRDI